MEISISDNIAQRIIIVEAVLRWMIDVNTSDFSCAWLYNQHTDTQMIFKRKQSKSDKGFYEWSAYTLLAEDEREGETDGICYDTNDIKTVPLPILVFLAEKVNLQAAKTLGLDLTVPL